jgi:hypothetical protein
MKKPNTSFYVTIVLSITIIVFISISKYRLKSNGLLMNARTTSWASTPNVGMVLKYEFYFQGKWISGANSMEPFRGNPNFINRYFPVMYYPEMAGQSQLLVRPSDFKDFNISYPDSLKWVLPYLK